MRVTAKQEARRIAVLAAVVLYAITASALVASCFREAPPCDQPGFDAVAETCVADGLDAAACNERLVGHEQRCTKRVEAE